MYKKPIFGVVAIRFQEKSFLCNDILLLSFPFLSSSLPLTNKEFGDRNNSF